MDAQKILREWLSTSVAIAVGITLTSSVQAQAEVNLVDILNSVFIGATQQKAATQPAASGQLPSGLQPSAAPPQPAQTVLWASKADFLAATRNGELIAIDKAASKELTPIAISIASILQTDYGVVLPFRIRDIKKLTDTCALSFEITIARALNAVTKLHADTLTQEPPDFYKDTKESTITDIGYMERNLKSANYGNDCDMGILGARKPHPYKAALLQLMGEYGQATKDYVEAERERRKTAYAEEQVQKLAQQTARDDAQAKRDAEDKTAREYAHQQQAREQKARADAQAKRDADIRAAEQQRINAERDRILREQKRREELERNRVGG